MDWICFWEAEAPTAEKTGDWIPEGSAVREKTAAKNDLEILAECRLFRGVDPEILRTGILPLGREKAIPKGDFLIRCREEARSFGVVLEGRIAVVHVSAGGDRSVMDAARIGDPVLADLVSTRNRISPYYAEATRNTRLLMFPADLCRRQELDRGAREALLDGFLRYVADENMRKVYRLAILARGSLRDRVMTYLSMQADKRHTDTVTVPFNREEMASFLCVNRPSLSRELGRMEHDGLLRFSKSTFTLLYRSGADGGTL